MADITEVIHKITYEINDDAIARQIDQIIRMSRQLDNMSDSLKISGTAATGLGKAFSQAFSKVNWIGLAVDGTKKLGEFAKESIHAALAAEELKIAFDHLNRPGLLAELRAATKGMVSDVELMRSAVTTDNLGMSLEMLAISMRYAGAMARQTGESVDSLTKKLLIGLGSRSDVILNNTGINVRRINEEFKRTGNYAEAATTVINEQLSQSGSEIMTYGDKVNVVGALWDNLKVKAGSALLSIGNAIGKEYLRANPLLEAMTGVSATQIELLEKERENYSKRKDLLHKYIRDYNEGSSQQRSRLINDAANLHLRLEKMEDTAGEKGLTKQAEHFKTLLRYVDEFYAQTIDKTTQQPENTLRALYAQKMILQNDLRGQAINGSAFNNTKKELSRIQRQIDAATGIGRGSSDYYSDRQSKLETQAKYLEYTDELLNNLIREEVLLENNYRQLYESDIAAGRQLTIEEKTGREKKYSDELNRIKHREALRLNELRRNALEKKLKLAQINKETADAAAIERQILEADRESASLKKDGAEFAAERIVNIPMMKTSAEIRAESRSEFMPRQVAPLPPQPKQKGLTEEQRKNIKEDIAAYQQLAQAAAEAYDKILQAQIDAADKEISLREKRVEEAKKLAERGNTEVLRLEEDRLRKAQEQRAKFARQQQAVNAAITVSNAIAAVARAALEGGGIGSFATIAALIAALAAGYAAVTSLPSDNGNSFADGVVDFQGKGGPRDDKNWVRISSGESVITAEGTKKHRALLEAINNGAHLQMINASLPFLVPLFKQPAIDSVGRYAAAKDLLRLETKLDEVVGAIEDNKLRQDVFFNEHGVGIMTEKAIQRNRSRWK